jgi:hypothetical protein
VGRWIGSVTVHLGVKRPGCPSVLPWCGVIGCSVEERLPIVLIYVNDWSRLMFLNEASTS